MANNIKKRFTVSLDIDTKDAEKQIKATVGNLKTILADIGSASDKMSYFKELSDYLSQVDSELDRFKQKHGDGMFNQIFGGLDYNLRKEMETVFGTAREQLTQLEQIRTRMSNIKTMGDTAQAKIELKELEQAAKDLFSALGMADKIKLTGKGSLETRLSKMEDALNSFANVWSGVNDKISAGFNFGGSGGQGGITGAGNNIVSEVQIVIDRLNLQNKRLIEAKEKFQEILKDFNNADKGISDKYKIEITEESVSGLVQEYDNLKEQFESSKVASSDYFNSLTKLVDVSLKLKKAFGEIYADDKLKELFSNASAGGRGGESNLLGVLSTYAVSKNPVTKDVEKVLNSKRVESVVNRNNELVAELNASNDVNALIQRRIDLYDKLKAKLEEYKQEQVLFDNAESEAAEDESMQKLSSMEKEIQSLVGATKKLEAVQTVLGQLAEEGETVDSVLKQLYKTFGLETPDNFEKRIKSIIAKGPISGSLGTGTGVETKPGADSGSGSAGSGGSGSGGGSTSASGGSGDGTPITDIDFTKLENTIKTEADKVVNKLDSALKVELVKDDTKDIQGSIDSIKAAVDNIGAAIEAYNTKQSSDADNNEINAMKNNLLQILDITNKHNAGKVGQSNKYQSQEMSISLFSDKSFGVNYGEKSAVPWNKVAESLLGNLSKSYVGDFHTHPLHMLIDTQLGRINKFVSDSFSGSSGDIGAFRKSKDLGAKISGMLTGNVMRVLNLSQLSMTEMSDLKSALASIEKQYASSGKYDKYIGIDEKGERYYKTQTTLKDQHEITRIFDSMLYDAFKKIGYSQDEVDYGIYQKYNLTDDDQLTSLATLLVNLASSADNALAPLDKLREIVHKFGGDVNSSKAQSLFEAYDKGEMNASDVFNNIADTGKYGFVSEGSIKSALNIDSANQLSPIETLISNISNLLSAISGSVKNIESNTNRSTSEQLGTAIDDIVAAKSGKINSSLIGGIKSIYDPRNRTQYKYDDVKTSTKDVIDDLATYVDIFSKKSQDDLQLSDANQLIHKFKKASTYLSDFDKQAQTLYHKLPTGSYTHKETGEESSDYDDLRSALFDEDKILRPLIDVITRAKSKIDSEIKSDVLQTTSADERISGIADDSAIGSYLSAISNSLDTIVSSTEKIAGLVSSADNNIAESNVDNVDIGNFDTNAMQNVGQEITNLTQLKQLLGDIQQAILAKTKAFYDEGVVVSQSVGKEISALTKLLEIVDNITPKINNLVVALGNINKQSTDVIQKISGEIAGTSGDTEPTQQSPFDKRKSDQLSALHRYQTSIKDADYATQDLNDRLVELGKELENATKHKDIDDISKKFQDIKKDVEAAKNSFEKLNLGNINAAEKDLESSFNKLDVTQQESVRNEYQQVLEVLERYKISVKDGNKVEISAIQSSVKALREKMLAYQDLNNKQKEQEKNQQKNQSVNAKFGSTQAINAQAKLNALRSESSKGEYKNSSVVQKALRDTEAAYTALINKRKALNAQTDEITLSQKAEFKELQTAYNDAAKVLNKILTDSEKLNHQFVNKDAYFLGDDFDYDSDASRKEALTNFVQETYGVNVALEDFKKNFNEVVFTVDNGDGTFTEMTATFNAARTQIGALAGDTKKVTSAFAQFWGELKGKFKSIFTYLTASLGWQEIWQQIRKGVQYVREIDSALTELKKVTDETDASYDKFLQDMSKTGSVIGATVADLTNMASEWARLGYSMEEAGKLAESTAILLNVSEFNDATAASEALISTMQAFQYTADQSQHVVDILNEVGNNYAVSSDGIATALQDSASALMEGGNNLEQATALVAAANKVVQDPNSVGSALRTISLRLRGTSVEVLEEMGEETDGVVESTSKLQEKIKALTGVDIVGMNGAYKDTYTILKEIGSVWKDMDAMDQAAALELMAGKNRANTLAAILNNMEDLEGAYESAMNAEGSALKENEAYLDSIQGRIDLFNNSVQTMWMNFMNTDVLKLLVNVGTGLVKIVDNIGLIKSALIGVSGYLMLFKKQDMQWVETLVSKAAGKSSGGGGIQFLSGDALASEINALNAAIKDGPEAFNNYKNAQKDLNNGMYQMIQSTDKAEYTTSDYTRALHNMAPAAQKAALKQNLVNAAIGIGTMVVTSAISSLISYVQNLKTLEDEYNDLQSSISSLEGEIKSLDSDLEAINEQIDSLSNKNLTSAEADELKRLREKSEELQKQKELQEDILKAREGQNQEKSLAMINKMLKTSAENQEHAAETGKTWGKILGTVLGAAAGIAISVASMGALTAAGVTIGAGVASGITMAAGTIGSQLGSAGGELAGGGLGRALNAADGTLVGWYESYAKAIEEAQLQANEAETKYLSDITDKNYEKWQDKVDAVATLQQEMYDGLTEMQEYVQNLEYNDQTKATIDEFNNLMAHISVTSTDGNIDAQINSIQSLEQEYERLSRGVDEHGNNIALTAEEYSRYQAIVAQVLGYNVGLTQGFTENGSAIYDASGKLIGYNNILAETIRLMKEQQKQAVIKAIEGENGDNQPLYDAYEAAKKANSSGFVKVDESRIGADSEAAGDLVDIISVKFNAFESFDDYVARNADLIAQHKDEILAAAEARGNVDIGYYREYLNSIEKYAKDDVLGNKFKQTLSLIPQLANEYENLSGSQLSFVNDYISSLEITDDMTEQEIENIKNNIIDLVDTIGRTPELQKTINELVALNPSSMPVGEYRSQFNELWSQVQLSIPDDQRNILLNKLFPDHNQIDARITAVKEKIINSQDDLVESLTAEELRIAYTIVPDIDGEMTLRELKKLIAEHMPEEIGPIVQSHSSLTEHVASFNEIVSQTSDIVVNNTKVTQEYKDSLIALGVSSEDLNDCFDATNPLVVKNADALNELVEATRNNSSQNAKLARTQAQLQYYELYKQIRDVRSQTDDLDDETLDYLETLYDQMDALEKTIAKYSILEAELLGTANAYNKLEAAQSADEAADYGSKAEELVDILGNAMNSRQLGTEAAQVAIEGLVPESVLENATTLQEKLDAIYGYFTSGPIKQLFTMEVDDNGVISNVEMTESGIKNFINSSDAFNGTWETGFSLKSHIDSMEEFMRVTNMTKEMAFAFFTELERYDVSWLNGNYTSMMDQLMSGDLEYAIYSTTNALADLEMKMARGDQLSESEQTRYGELTASMSSLGDASRESIIAYDEASKAMSGLKEELEGYQAQLDSGEITPERFAQKTAEITDKMSELGAVMGAIEPTELTMTVALDDVQKDIDAVTSKLKDRYGKFTIDAFIDFNKDTGVYTVKTKYQKDQDLVKLADYLNEEHKLEIALGEDFKTVEEQLGEIVKILEDIYKIKVGVDDTDVWSWWDEFNRAGLVKKVSMVAEAVGDWFSGSNVNGNETSKNGRSRANGTAFVGGNIGAPKTEESLVGELGPEIRVRGNRWDLLGQNGAEFVDIRKGDIIFNHKQSEELLKNGRTASRGKINGSAFAGGTTKTSGSAYALAKGTTASEGVVASRSVPIAVDQAIALTNKAVEAANKATLAASNASVAISNAVTQGYSGSVVNAASELAKVTNTTNGDTEKDKEDEFEELFDWVAVKLEEIAEDLEIASAKLENAVGADNKNAIIDDMIDINISKKSTLLDGIKEYNAQAKEILSEIPKEYHNKVKDGTIDIEKFYGEVDEGTYKAIEEYREWAQKAADLEVELEGVNTTIRELAKQKFDNIVSDYENQISLTEAANSKLQAQIDLLEESGEIPAPDYYTEMMDNTRNMQIQLEHQRKAMQASLNSLVESGDIPKYSEEWYEMVNAIHDVDEQIIQCTQDIESFQNAINDIHWDNFDNLVDAIEMIEDEISSLIDIMEFGDIVDELGNFTNDGIASLGLYAQQMEVAQYKTRQLAEEIEYLNATKDKYSEAEYQEKLADLTSKQYDAIKAYQQAKNAIVDTQKARVDAIKKGIDKEIEAYEKLIQKQKESLNAAKDLHDFEKTVADQSKNIANIERKIAALASDNSASAIAQRKRLEQELAEAKAELEETYYDRSVDQQQEALDNELDSFKEEKDREIEQWDAYLDNVEALVAESLGFIQANSETVYDTLSKKASEYGIDISDYIMNAWAAGSSAIDAYDANFSASSSATLTELEKIEKKWQDIIALMVEAAGKAISDQNTQNTTTTAATQQPTTVTPQTPAEDTSKKAQNGTYEVKSGDSLWAIAAKMLGSGARWKEIYNLNKDIIKDPNLIRPGWKLKLPAYAKGTLGTPSSGLAVVDEEQLEELVLGVENGRLTYLQKGSAVLPNKIAENLMSWGSIDPSGMLDQNRPSIGVSPSVVNNTMELSIDNSIDTLISIEHFDGNNPDDVLKIVNKAIEKHDQQFTNALKKYVR